MIIMNNNNDNNNNSDNNNDNNNNSDNNNDNNNNKYPPPTESVRETMQSFSMPPNVETGYPCLFIILIDKIFPFSSISMVSRRGVR